MSRIAYPSHGNKISIAQLSRINTNVEREMKNGWCWFDVNAVLRVYRFSSRYQQKVWVKINNEKCFHNCVTALLWNSTLARDYAAFFLHMLQPKIPPTLQSLMSAEIWDGCRCSSFRHAPIIAMHTLEELIKANFSWKQGEYEEINCFWHTHMILLGIMRYVF